MNVISIQFILLQQSCVFHGSVHSSACESSSACKHKISTNLKILSPSSSNFTCLPLLKKKYNDIWGQRITGLIGMCEGERGHCTFCSHLFIMCNLSLTTFCLGQYCQKKEIPWFISPYYCSVSFTLIKSTNSQWRYIIHIMYMYILIYISNEKICYVFRITPTCFSLTDSSLYITHKITKWIHVHMVLYTFIDFLFYTIIDFWFRYTRYQVDRVWYWLTKAEGWGAWQCLHGTK